MPQRLTIIGAGPVGLEAALTARARGYEVHVFERGACAGDAVRRWGHVRMFSPFEMNASAGGMAALRKAGAELPGPEALLTGREFAACYLDPLAALLNGRVHFNSEVIAIGRSRTAKGEKIGDPARAAEPFRLLVGSDGKESVHQADYVFDCSGTFLQPNPLGAGGVPAAGESACGRAISTGVPDVSGAERARFQGRRVLVVGGGHSAATVVRDLATLPERGRRGSIVWCVRREVVLPCSRIADDPLPERDSLMNLANALVSGGRVDFRAGSAVDSLRGSSRGIEVVLANATTTEVIVVDQIVSAVGFRPNLELARELQVQTCYATEGTYPLAASMLGDSDGDCLAITTGGAEMLRHPEPGFFTLGMKSYGRAPNFLIRSGYEQIRSVLDSLAQ